MRERSEEWGGEGTAGAATMAQVVARGDSLQMPGAFSPVPGDALSHYTAGFATTLCGATFLTGLTTADAAANSRSRGRWDAIATSTRCSPAISCDWARLADGRPVYGGGFFWVNGDGKEPMPRDAYAMLGAGGQSAWIIPSNDLVIVRIGKYRGSSRGEAARRKGTATLLQAIGGAGS